MTGHLLLRGMIVGFIAGLLAFGFARVYGEPQVDRAIAYEEQMNAAAGAPAEPEAVSRETQAGIGLFTGIVTYSTALGGIFALVFAFSLGRVSSFGPRGTAALLALAGFVALVVVPGLKYPGNPPAVGSPETIGVRTELYFVMIAISIAATAAAVSLAAGLRARHGAWNATIIAGAGFVAFIAIAQALLPEINEIPEQFSATLLWQFRMATLGIHIIVWTTLGLLFGALAERLVAQRQGTRGALRMASR